MAKYITNDTDMKSVADAIRAKTGKTNLLTYPTEFVSEIAGIETGGTDLSLGLTGAAAGQIAKISAVDADGRPTAWTPVDMPSGAAGGETWELLANITTEEDIQDIDVTENIAGHKKFWIVLATTTKAACQIWIAGNDRNSDAWVLAYIPYSNAGQKSMITKIEDSVDGRIIGNTNYSSQTNGADQDVTTESSSIWMSSVSLKYSAPAIYLGYASVSAINKLKIWANSGTNTLKAGTRVRIYGVKA